MAIHFYVQDRDLNDMMDNWRDDAHFKQFIDSFPEDAEYTADKLVNDFLKQAKLIHTKHFSQWRDKYLHLALGGDAIPAQCISNWLLGKEIPPELPATYHSDTHKTTINTAACYTFLTGDQLPAAYTSKLFFNSHRIAIQELAEGNKIWDENTSENMQKFKDYIKKEWLIVVSNTQLVERWVKDSNECTLSGKSDHFASIIAVCRSATVFDYKEDAKIEAEGRELKGNQFKTKGIKGERILKKTGEIELPTKLLKDIRGAHYSALVIAKTIKRNEMLERMPGMNENRIITLRKLTNREQQYRAKRTDTTIEEYSQILLSDTPYPAPNAIQRQKGIESTSHMRGEVIYSKLRIVHIALVREELLFRGVQFEKEWSIKKLVQCLKEGDIASQKIVIEGETGNTNPKESELKTKSFLPLSRSADAYKID